MQPLVFDVPVLHGFDTRHVMLPPLLRIPVVWVCGDVCVGYVCVGGVLCVWGGWGSV